MNWGYKILIVYGLFVAGILFMVFKSSFGKMDLVTTDYYEKELKYQEKIDEMNRVSKLSETIKFDVINNEMAIIFPDEFTGKNITGNAELYCPSDEDKDFTWPFDTRDKLLKITIPSKNKGLHEFHLNWKVEGVSYYFEKKIFL